MDLSKTNSGTTAGDDGSQSQSQRQSEKEREEVQSYLAEKERKESMEQLSKIGERQYARRKLGELLAHGRHGKEQVVLDLDFGIFEKHQYHKTIATTVMLGLQIITLAAAVVSMNKSLDLEKSDNAKVLWVFLLGCTLASIPFWLYGFLLFGLERCNIAARVVTGIGYIATVFGLISALGLLLPQEFMLGGTASVGIICLPGLIGNAIYGNDKHIQTIVVWGGQIVSVAAAVFSKNNSPEMSPNAKILWRFLLGCTFTSIPFWLYGSLLLGLKRHNGVAARVFIGIGYIATVFGLISALGLLLPDELMLWSTASACIICLPALIGYAGMGMGVVFEEGMLSEKHV